MAAYVDVLLYCHNCDIGGVGMVSCDICGALTKPTTPQWMINQVSDTY